MRSLSSTCSSVIRRPRALLRMLLVLAAIAASVAVVDTATVTAEVTTSSTTTVTAGNVISYARMGLQGSPRNFFIDPDRQRLFTTSEFDGLRQVDVTTLGTGPGPIFDGFPAVGGYPVDVAVSRDGTLAYVLLWDFSVGEATKIQIMNLTTGQVSGSALTVTDPGVKLLASRIAVHEPSGGPVVVYAFDSGQYAFNPLNARRPTLTKVTLSANPLSASTFSRHEFAAGPLSQSFTYQGHIAVAADGSEVYVGISSEPQPVPIEVVRTSDMTRNRTIAVNGSFQGRGSWLGVHAANGSTKGHLYVLEGEDGSGTPGTHLRSLNLDNNDQLIRTVSPATVNPTALAVDAMGNAAIGHDSAVVAYVPTGAAEAILTTYRTQGGQDMGARTIRIDTHPTFGTCIYADGERDAAFVGFTVDDADCGVFRAGFTELPALPVDGTVAAQLDAPTPSSLEQPWVGIGVFVDGVLKRVEEPPFGNSLALKWADFTPGFRLELRAYNQAQLAAAGVTALAEIGINTPYTHSISSRIQFVPLEAQTVVVGGQHGCALDSGTVYCWGYGSGGQLGDGTDLTTSPRVTERLVAHKVVQANGFRIRRSPHSMPAAGTPALSRWECCTAGEKTTGVT